MPALYVVLSKTIAESTSPELVNVRDAIEEVLEGTRFTFMKSDAFQPAQRGNVLFGCFVPEDTEVYPADQLLGVGVPIVVVGDTQATANFRSSLKDRGFQADADGLIYRLPDQHRVRGAIHWVVNYHGAIKNLAVQAAVEQWRRNIDTLGIAVAQSAIR
jgi:hypothetical protein